MIPIYLRMKYLINLKKENCEYYKIITSENGNDYVSYSCSESLYKGKIGFRVEDKMGIIWNFPNE